VSKTCCGAPAFSSGVDAQRRQAAQDIRIDPDRFDHVQFTLRVLTVEAPDVSPAEHGPWICAIERERFFEVGMAPFEKYDVRFRDRARTSRSFVDEGELADAIAGESDERVASEAADLVYHLLVGLRLRDVELRRVIEVLAKRSGVSGLEEKAQRQSKT